MKNGQEESRGTHRNDEATYHRNGRGWRRTPGFRIRHLIRVAVLDVHRNRIITQSIAEGKVIGSYIEVKPLYSTLSLFDASILLNFRCVRSLVWFIILHYNAKMVPQNTPGVEANLLHRIIGAFLNSRNCFS